MPNAQLIGFERCMHHPQVAHAEKFNRIVRKFLLGEKLHAFGELV